ncbi:uncharacterized protein LOC141692279 isoform X2 [Apium graveolens]|uniref:uncharacterized protein LOC141692279 isoform X2 n=1 Tax=Apium graveolens TaxID=4045 RepID=UPI003D79A158
MADKSSPAEWLPAGWTWTVKTCRNGRKYKVFTDPSQKLKFLSKPEVIRYLDSVGSSLPPNSEDNSDDSGHPKSLEESKESPATYQGNEVQDGRTAKVLMSNEEILTPAITEDHICLRYPNSDQMVEDYPKKLLKNGVNKSNSKRSADFPRRASKRLAGIELDPEPMKLIENGMVHETGSVEHRINKSNSKRSSDFPRRASKRLAGVELDPVPEPKPDDRTCRSAAQYSGEAATSSVGNTHDLPAIKEQLESKMESSTIFKEQAEKEKPLPATREQDGDEQSMMISEERQGEKKKLLSVSNLKAAEKEHANDIDAILESSTNFSMEDLLEDPCIEFAIKTLTGVIPIGEENQAEKISGSSAEMSFSMGEENRADKNSGSSAEMSLSDIWTDPCFEFAVKTLTGVLPLDEDPGSQNLFQQQLSSADTRGIGGTVIPNKNNFCQTDYTLQHCTAVEKPQYRKQPATAATRIPQTSTRSLQISSGSGLHQSIQDGTSGQRP